MRDHDKPFHELFREHLEQGTRADQDPGNLTRRPWKQTDFAAQAGVDPRTITNWKNHTRTPLSTEFATIVALLFGDNPLHATAKATLLAAWQKADSRRGLPGRKTSRTSTTAKPATWKPEPPFTLNAALGRLWIHRTQGHPDPGPLPGNNVTLEVTVETGRIFISIEATSDTPRIDTDFAVTAAEIVVTEWLHLTPVKGTALGADIKHPNVSFASSWHLKVPLADDGMRGGIIIEQATLRQYAVLPGQPFGIRLELRCRDIDLKPIDETILPALNDNQRAILRRRLQADSADPDSLVICLARDELEGQADP